MKVFVIIEGGAVREIVSDVTGVQVLVVDREIDGCDLSTIIRDLAGGPAAVDAMHHALPVRDEVRLEDVFSAAAEGLRILDTTQSREIQAALFAGAEAESFAEVVDDQGWGNDTELVVLKDFIAEMRLEDRLVKYAKAR